MNEKSIDKIIEILQTTGSETVQLYAERAATSGILSFSISGALAMAFFILSLSFLSLLKKEEHVVTGLCFLCFTISLAVSISGLIEWLHPEATAIDQLIRDVRPR